MKIFKYLTLIQATYFLVTAVWPIVHIQSFMEVTGYKTDIWLVKTVGALLIPISICLMMFLFISADKRPALALGSLCAWLLSALTFIMH
jgi:hypothetical protein